MTPPAKPAASAGASADVKVVTPPPPPATGPAAEPKKEEKPVEDKDPKRLEWKFSLGLGAETQGGRNGNLFAIDNISQFGDFTHFLLNGGLAYDLNKGKVRFRAGGQVQFDASKGGENTSGSNLWALGLGPRVELDWKRAYGDGLGGVFVGPGSIGLYGLLGYGWGTTNVDGGFQLHKQSGLATAVGADVNVFGFNVGNVHIGADFYAQTTAINGGDFNNAGWSMGGMLTFRPSTKKMTIEKDVPVCDGAKRSIDSYIDSIAQLRADNTKVKADLDELKGFLEGGSDPLTTANIRDALFYREVRIALVSGGADEKTVREALRKAYVAKKEGKDEKTTDAIIIAGVKDLKQDKLDAAKATAAGKYPEGYDFWAQVTGDPVPTELPSNIKDLDCGEIDKWVERLHQEELDLTKRNRDLKGRFDTAVLVDALKDHLGKNVEKFVDKVHGFVLDFVQPNFNSAHPDEKDFARLQEFVDKNKGTAVSPNDPALLKVLAPIFALPEWESQNLKDLADKMNGKLDPSWSRTFTEKDSGKKFDPSPTDADADTKFGWMKAITWKVEGHTDSDGSNEMNQKLSERRAGAIANMLQLFGVNKDRLETIGYGETRLAVPEKGNGAAITTAKNKNRRVIIRVKGEAASAPLNSIPDGTKTIPDDEKKAGDPKPKAPDPKPKAPDPQPKAPDPKPKAPDPKPQGKTPEF